MIGSSSGVGVLQFAYLGRVRLAATQRPVSFDTGLCLWLFFSEEAGKESWFLFRLFWLYFGQLRSKGGTAFLASLCSGDVVGLAFGALYGQAGSPPSSI